MSNDIYDKINKLEEQIENLKSLHTYDFIHVEEGKKIRELDSGTIYVYTESGAGSLDIPGEVLQKYQDVVKKIIKESERYYRTVCKHL